MERLSDQLRDWHNKNPLAKRIHISDVHTVGVVALPFMQGSGMGQIEPSLDAPASLESQAAVAPKPPWWHDLRGLLGRLRGQPKVAGTSSGCWPVFSEPLIAGISATQMGRFALEHGYRERPGDPSWPQRGAPIDDRLVHARQDAHGAWPTEIYLVSAGIDAGASYTRVLIGQGDAGRLSVIGRRCLDPLRTGLAVMTTVAVIGFFWGYSSHLQRSADAESAAAAASAASAAHAASAASAAEAASAALAALQAASRAAEAASEAASAADATSAAGAATPSASEAASGTPPDAAASEPEPQPSIIPNIRPQLVSTPRTRKAAEEAEAARQKEAAAAQAEAAKLKAPPASPTKAASQGATTPAVLQPARDGKATAMPEKANTSAAATATPASRKSTGPGPAATATPEPDNAPMVLGKDLQRPPAAASGKLVALVGPPSASKAEAEALLERLRGMIAPNIGSNTALQGQVFQSPDGWRAAIWPFASREEAQLINATLVARGMRTKAVDF